MASMGAPSNRNPLDVVNLASYCLKIHGQYHHLTSTSMRPGDGQAPRFAQLYFLDMEEAVNHRMDNEANQGSDPVLIRDLSCFMVQCNEFAKTFKMMRQVERGKEIDNRWMVPYLPYLIMKYDRHTNLEIDSSVKSVKYLYKYIHKGFDCAAIEVQARDGTRLITIDEVNSFLDARYISAPEAMWRLNGYDLFMKSHTVTRLTVHLPNCQMKETKWKPRQRGGEIIISRLYTVSIKDTERFYLRLLLHVAGAKCFEDLRTVDGVLYETFMDAAIVKNLVEADDLWAKTLEEATGSHMPAQLRQLFAYICIFGTSADVPTLWNRYKDSMIEDFVHNNIVNPENMALNHIQEF
ncbi:hypothetical protein RF55_15093 [Lasius niger]|uniref:Uncharacterized protein n=1 Tax=Lasius niger TaxID=67767 RepID=A0A0J7K6Q5_LASNI|nr:hypothetical protein RF55_15093 [Lasius niger]